MHYTIRTEIAKDGNPIPIINDFILHSKYSPAKEGEQLIKAQLDKHPRQENLIVFGLGFGYHLLPIYEQYKEIYVVESIQELIESAKSQSFLQPLFSKIKIISSLEEAHYIEQTDFLKLNSEMRFQDKFFNEVYHIISTPASVADLNMSDIRILVNFPIYGGSYTTAQYVSQALTRMGCEVEVLDNSMANEMLQYILSMNSHQNETAEKLTELLSDLIWEKFLNFKPHIVFCLAQAPVSKNLLKAIQKAGSIVVFWFVEDYRRFPYWKDICVDTDYFFVIQQNEFLDMLKDTTQSAYAYLPMAADEEVHRKIHLNHEEYKFFGSDLSFMGAAFPNRVAFFDQLREFNLKLWGSGWEAYDQFSKLNLLPGKRISIEESVKIYNASKININLHSSMGNDLFDPYGDFINPRTFEICACGGFQLVDRRPVLSEFFKEDEDLVMFSSVDEAIDKIRYYLSHEDIRKRIALRGQEKVLSNHTYKHRMTDGLSAIINSTSIIKHQVSEERNKITKLLEAVKDSEFTDFIMSLSVSERTNVEFIMKKIKENKGKFKNFEVALLLLESFYRGE